MYDQTHEIISTKYFSPPRHWINWSARLTQLTHAVAVLMERAGEGKGCV